MERIVLGLFCAALVLGIVLDVSMLWALGFGLLLFWVYGRRRGFSWRALAKMTWEGVATVWKILFTFLLIGVMTALWRAAGTVPFLVCQASMLIRPGVFLLMSFLLNCGLSVLTGTSFGTAATMGVICAAMGTAMGVSPMLTGGAITSPLIPWCIAGAVPLAMVGAPRTALLLAVYLWLIPLLRSLRRRA